MSTAREAKTEAKTKAKTEEQSVASDDDAQEPPGPVAVKDDAAGADSSLVVDGSASATAAGDARTGHAFPPSSDQPDTTDTGVTDAAPETATTASMPALDCGSTSAIRRVLCSEDADHFVSSNVLTVMTSHTRTSGSSENALNVNSRASEREVSNDDADVATDQATSSNDDERDASLEEFTAESDIAHPQRRIWIVTTAALPWRTGTAVNPLLRALCLTRTRPKHHVTLVIPWLEKESSRRHLYGPDNVFDTWDQQEDWIRDYCRTRAHCVQEEPMLNILFYAAVYNKAFGSIFPSEDICGLIPPDQADVAILEEPEHLNWFRIARDRKTKKSQSSTENNAKQDDIGDAVDVLSDAGSAVLEPMATETGSATTTMEPEAHMDGNSNTPDDSDKLSLGWAHKFRHVVGILHTNYSAYMTQYAVGTSFIAAPAISMLSSIVVRAYCHRVIRLSDALPSLAAKLEVTCNVHGVRSEFLMPPVDVESVESYAKVYFIGKLIWAKGFDRVLEMQDLYRQATGEYLAMDVYGGGPDEKAIRRAFHGRKGVPMEEAAKATPPDQPDTIPQSASESSDASAAAVFDNISSLRRQVSVLSTTTEASGVSAIEVEPIEDSQTRNAVQITTVADGEKADEASPIAVLGDLGSLSISTGLETSQAVYGLAESLVNAGLKMTFSTSRVVAEEKSSFFLDPPKSRYEWRRNPIPARFMGVKDHALLRDISEHTVFLNMSTTEVLCTTTAEALGMGKWAIIPKHPSNAFFLQFKNCLEYTSLSNCVEKLRYALETPPTPLSEQEHHKFTWEGATERFFQASGITKREFRDRQHKDSDTSDERIAWFHTQSLKTGNVIRRVFSHTSLEVLDATNDSNSGTTTS